MPAFQLKGRNDPRLQGLDAFTQAYIEAAIFTEEESLGGIGTVAVQQLADQTVFRFLRDCSMFQRRTKLEEIPEHACRLGTDTHSVAAQAGHDFWMTRNGHGVGFWDGDWIEPYAGQLDRLAKSFGQVDLYRGRDGRIYS